VCLDVPTRAARRKSTTTTDDRDDPACRRRLSRARSHAAFSTKGRINQLLGFTLDLIGASGMVWSYQVRVRACA